MNISKPIFIISAVGAVSCGAIILKDYLGSRPYKTNNDVAGKVFIITGTTSGIGKATAHELAKLNAKIVMACKDSVKCEEIREQLVIETKNKYIYCRKCDLASQKSIINFVETFKKEHDRLDVLINNAGIMYCPKNVTEDGIEMQLGVNYMGHFLLTNLLLDKLKESAPSRIVVLSDIAYKKGIINKEDLNSVDGYNKIKAYEQSKLANIMFVRELDKRLKGTNVTVNAVNPGIVSTALMRHMGYYDNIFASIFVRPLLWPFIKSPRQGSYPVLYVSLAPELNDVSGKCFKYDKEEELSPQALDDKTSHWLWLLSEKWMKIKKIVN